MIRCQAIPFRHFSLFNDFDLFRVDNFIKSTQATSSEYIFYRLKTRNTYYEGYLKSVNNQFLIKPFNLIEMSTWLPQNWWRSKYWRSKLYWPFKKTLNWNAGFLICFGLETFTRCLCWTCVKNSNTFLNKPHGKQKWSPFMAVHWPWKDPFVGFNLGSRCCFKTRLHDLRLSKLFSNSTHLRYS